MKPHHFVCCTVLLARSIPAVWGHTVNITHNRKGSHPSFQSWPSIFTAQCSHPSFPSWPSIFTAQCSHPSFQSWPSIFTAQCSHPSFPSWPSIFTTQCSHLDTPASSEKKVPTMSGQKSDNLPLGVRSLRGLGSGDHTMDVIVAGKRHGAQEHVIFFGGDVQDYPENMESHRDNGRYVRWNLLETAERLCERFPSALVLVMKPHHMHLKTFSVYSQFVQSNNFGVPTHTPNYGAWERLVSVYEEAVGIVLGPARSRNDGVNCNQNGCGGSDAGSAAGAVSEPPVEESGDSKTSSPPPDQDTEQQSPAGCLPQDVSAGESQSANRDSDSPAASSVSPLLDLPVHLVAFSKGCIVLNQLLQELNAVENNQAVQKFVLRVRTMTWLDGGHSGGSNTWVTDPGALERLAALGVEIHVHVTPYQVKDEMRVWIGKEKRRFVELLQKAGANVHDTLHFDNEPKSIENHFRVLEVF